MLLEREYSRGQCSTVETFCIFRSKLVIHGDTTPDRWPIIIATCLVMLCWPSIVQEALFRVAAVLAHYGATRSLSDSQQPLFAGTCRATTKVCAV